MPSSLASISFDFIQTRLADWQGMSKQKRIPKQVREYFARIGATGGKASSPAKTQANKQNALVRWAKVKRVKPSDQATTDQAIKRGA